MIIIRKLYSFKVEQSDLLNIYILYIRSILEQSCQVWHYDITQEEVLDLERVQKCAFRIILQDDYLSYEHALQTLEMDTLKARRDILCLKFAKSCVKHPKAKGMFPLNTATDFYTRERETFYVQHAETSRLRDSTIPQLQRALNAELQ